jgi:hypothetical protein
MWIFVDLQNFKNYTAIDLDRFGPLSRCRRRVHRRERRRPRGMNQFVWRGEHQLALILEVIVGTVVLVVIGRRH